MRKYLPAVISCVIIKAGIHWVGNQNYGFHRDELLHLSVSEHLAAGYFEFPPFIALAGKLSFLLFDYSLTGVRFFATLAGICMLIVCILMVKEMGGKQGAAWIAGATFLAFIPYFRTHLLFQPVAFDQLFWTLGFYFFLRFINSEKNEYLILLGITAGIGLLNKYTMLIWGFGLTVGILFYNRGTLFRSKWLYVSGVIAFLIFLPNLIWQIQHDMPFFMHMEALKAKQLDELGTWDFLLGQIEIPPVLTIVMAGLYGLFLNKHLKKYRSLGIAFAVIFCTMWILKAKAYYFFAAYPVVFAAGAVLIEQWTAKKPLLNYFVAASVFFPMIYFIPETIPVLPVEKHIEYRDLEPADGHYSLTSDYADMFGWEEQVALVDSVYQSLPDSVAKATVIWAENYGEAGAIQILGDKYGLPEPISRHGSFWLWGYGNPDASMWISLGNEPEAVNYVFEDCKLIRTIRHQYAIDEENGIPLYICRTPKVNIPDWWADYKNKVFQ